MTIRSLNTNQKGQLFERASGLHVIAGQNAQIPMTTRLPASLDVQVIDAQSGEPVPGIAVYLTMRMNHLRAWV
jgi:hypothetical protein